jgi:glycosyltransferase involved in cell wall biosynthesis
MLSVIVFSYNHRKYIEKCIDSILAQQTDFDYEILLADDCSTDDTAKVVQGRYGEKVRILDRPKNLGLCRNMYEAFMEARGKYIFECAGDDFLLTEQVFQKHVDFLENNPEYFSIFNLVKTINMQTGKENVRELPYTEFSLLDFLQGKQAHFYMGTVRNSFREDNPDYFCRAGRNNEEIQMVYYTLSKGRKKILPEALYAYCYRTDVGNYCSTHNYLDVLDDYAKGFHAVEAADEGKHNFRIAKIWIYESYIDKILQSKDRQLIRGIYRVLGWRDFLDFVWIKFLMKLNHRQMPDFLLKESRLIRQ